ncbi:MAG: hypothetical protein V3U67_07315 [Gemmatimonadota bacterium]
MSKGLLLLAPLAALPLLAGCQAADTDTSATVGSGAELVMTLPISTESDEARAHLEAGLAAADMARGNDANDHFEKAVEADPEFAQGYLRVANTAASTEEFTTNLKRAVELMDTAEPAERLLIEIAQKGFENDVEGQLQKANELVELTPESPRAWLTLAGIQGGLNDADGARKSYAKTIEIAPKFAAAYMQAGNNYLFIEPKDFSKAEEHFQTAADLAPGEPNPYDLLGDVHRAQGDLEAAYDDYTRAAERAPDLGSPIQQRGHVNSFLHRFDEARADYTRSMELETARGNNTAPFFAPFRAYVSLHEGNPDAAIAELRVLVDGADESGYEGITDIKINGLTNIARIAMHSGAFDIARSALDERATLMRQQAEETGTEEFARAQERGIIYLDAMLAARQGDAETAKAKADEFGVLAEMDPNPRGLEPMHQILGITEHFQGNYEAAIEHLVQGAPGNIYMKYYRAIALQEAGMTEEASGLMDEIAVWNFNGVGFALIRNDVMERVGQS